MTVACTQKMALQPYNRPYTPSDVFADGSSARPIPADTVARGHVQHDSVLFMGKDSSGHDTTVFPFPITREVLQRGRDRFEIYCVPCHGYTGDGDGLVVQRGFNPPPSYNTDRLCQAPVGHFFDVVSNGFGAMPSYASQTPSRIVGRLSPISARSSSVSTPALPMRHLMRGHSWRLSHERDSDLSQSERPWLVVSVSRC